MFIFLSEKRNIFLYLLSILSAPLIFWAASIVVIFIATIIFLHIVFYPLFISFYRAIYRLKEGFDEKFEIDMRDEHKISAYYYNCTGKKKNTYPVILCHGLGANHTNFDVSVENGFVAFLKKKGYSFYSIDLRRTANGKGEVLLNNLIEDIDEIIKAINLREGNKATSPVHWVGHSMGAIIMYMYLAKKKSNNTRIKSFSAISGPLDLQSVAHPIVDIFIKASAKASNLNINLSLVGALFATLAGRFPNRLEDYLYNMSAFNRKDFSRFLCHGLSNSPPSLAKQLTSYITPDRIEKDATYRLYENCVEKITSPIFILSGAQDFLCNTEMTRKTYARLKHSSANKKLTIFSKANGYHDNYCHGSILMGKHATLDVFPEVASWIEKFDY